MYSFRRDVAASFYSYKFKSYCHSSVTPRLARQQVPPPAVAAGVMLSELQSMARGGDGWA